MSTPGSWRGVLNHYRTLPRAIQKHFEHLPELMASFPWDVSLAYQFARIELAHNMTIYCGAVKLHRAHPELAWLAVQNQHQTRDSFRTLFAAIIGHELPKGVISVIEPAEIVRDSIMHGKDAPEPKKRAAVVSVLDYAAVYNDYVNSKAGLRPCGDLRGFKGRAKSLDKGTTRWLLKGMGLALQ
jgi:hypothetical protein